LVSIVWTQLHEAIWILAAQTDRQLSDLCASGIRRQLGREVNGSFHNPQRPHRLISDLIETQGALLMLLDSPPNDRGSAAARHRSRRRAVGCSRWLGSTFLSPLASKFRELV
jgi:hypothetical protein